MKVKEIRELSTEDINAKLKETATKYIHDIAEGKRDFRF